MVKLVQTFHQLIDLSDLLETPYHKNKLYDFFKFLNLRESKTEVTFSQSHYCENWFYIISIKHLSRIISFKDEVRDDTYSEGSKIRGNCVNDPFMYDVSGVWACELIRKEFY